MKQPQILVYFFFLLIGPLTLRAQKNDSFSPHELQLKTVCDLVYAGYAVNSVPFLTIHVTELQQIMGEMEMLGHFKTWSLPFSLRFESQEDQERFQDLCVMGEDLLARIQKTCQDSLETVPGKHLSMTLAMAGQPGDYYSGISGGDLGQHPFREDLQILQLQDFPIADHVSGDRTLLNLNTSAPNLQQVILFGTELTNDWLTELHLESLSNLKVAQLSENRLTEFPESLASSPKLLVLDLRKNNISKLPANLKPMNHLRYLNLSQNPISRQEQQRIREALPDTEVLFY